MKLIKPFRALSRALPAQFSGAFSDALSAPQRASASLIRISESVAHFRGLRNFYGDCKRVIWTNLRGCKVCASVHNTERS